jgi:hypothetical protein
MFCRIALPLLMSFVAAAPAFGQSSCGGSRGNVAGPALYLMNRGALSAPLPRSVTLNLGQLQQGLQLSYSVQSPARSAHAGMLVIKIYRPVRIEAGGVTTEDTIRVRRKAYPYVCGRRDLYGWFHVGQGLVDEQVPVRDYIYYHKTTSDVSQTLTGFHVNYRDDSGVCTATDDRSNGNRQQFLYGRDRRPENLIAGVFGRGLSSGVAAATEGPAFRPFRGTVERIARRLPNEERLTALVTSYARFGKKETQLHPYNTANARCVQFDVPDPQHGQIIVVQVNDLEERQNGGSRARIERAWRFRMR